MAALNPNPGRISGPLWWLWTDFDSFEPSVQLGGIYAAKGGYHDTRQAAGSGDYSVGEVPADRNGPGDKASAIDLTMPQAQMIKYTTRLRDAAKRRDERLYIGGVPILREFIGTDNGSRVYCYVLTGGRARGLSADASDDWGRDSTHLWHVHLSIIRQFCADSGAMSRLASVMRGEPLATWKARVNPAPPASPEEEEFDVTMNSYPLPSDFAYDAGEQLIDGEAAISVPVEPAGFASNPVFGSKRLYLSLAGDHIPDGSSVRVRIAIHNGTGWTIDKYDVKAGGRISCKVPAAASGAAFNITAGRMMSGPDAAEGETTVPVSLLVTVA